MRLSLASSYALHALAHLAGQNGNGLMASHHIAAACKIPDRFLLKVLKLLVIAQLLRSLKGPNGGYRLARDASRITMLEVIEAIEGPLRGEAPLASETVKGRGDLDARLEVVCEQSAAFVRRQLGGVKLSDLVGKR